MTHDKDAKIEKPLVCSEGYSDPVAVLTDNKMILVAVWDTRDGFWHSFENGDEETFGNVEKWYPLPAGWLYDSDLYAPTKNGCQLRTDEASREYREYQENWRGKAAMK